MCINTNKLGNTFVIIFVFCSIQTAGSKSGNVIMKCIFKSGNDVYDKIGYLKVEETNCLESALNKAIHGSLPYSECVISINTV